MICNMGKLCCQNHFSVHQSGKSSVGAIILILNIFLYRTRVDQSIIIIIYFANILFHPISSYLGSNRSCASLDSVEE